MHLIKEKLDIEESLEKKIKSTLKFLNIKSELKNGNKIILKYNRENILYEPLKIIPLLNKKGINNITHYGIVEVPLIHRFNIRI